MKKFKVHRRIDASSLIEIKAEFDGGKKLNNADYYKVCIKIASNGILGPFTFVLICLLTLSFQNLNNNISTVFSDI